MICIVSWPLYRDTYRIVTLLVIHSPNRDSIESGGRCTYQGFSCIENYEAAASAKFCAASGCRQNSGRLSRASVTEQCPLELLVHIWKNTDILYKFTWYFFTQNHNFYSFSTDLRDLMSINSVRDHLCMNEWRRRAVSFTTHTHTHWSTQRSRWVQRLPSL